MLCAIDETGCFAKVFDVVSSACLYSFKRGIKACTISNACFDFDNSYLAVSSSAGTVHVFALRTGPVTTAVSGSGMGGTTESTASSSSLAVAKSPQSKLVETGFSIFRDLKAQFCTS